MKLLKLFLLHTFVFVNIGLCDEASNALQDCIEMSKMQRKLIDTLLSEEKAYPLSISSRNIIKDMATIGDAFSRKLIIQRMNHKNSLVRINALEDASRVGGNDMINSIALLLYDDSGFTNIYKGEVGPNGEVPQSIIIAGPIRYYSTMYLQKMVENPPTKNVERPTDEDVEKWKTWWEHNKEHYK